MGSPVPSTPRTRPSTATPYSPPRPGADPSAMPSTSSRNSAPLAPIRWLERSPAGSLRRRHYQAAGPAGGIAMAAEAFTQIIAQLVDSASNWPLKVGLRDMGRNSVDTVSGVCPQGLEVGHASGSNCVRAGDRAVRGGIWRNFLAKSLHSGAGVHGRARTGPGDPYRRPGSRLRYDGCG